MTTPLFHPPVADRPSHSRPRRGGWSWGLVEGAKLRVLSLGAGVQSTTLVYMMVERELPWVDAIIFADTGDDSRATMEHLARVEADVRRATNHVEIHRVSRGGRLSDRIRARATDGGSKKQDRFVTIPAFTASGGQGKRQCTRDFKIEPLERKQRELLGYAPRKVIPPRSAEIWIGISTDEVVRAGAAHARWAVNRYPLLEARMSRRDCETWLVARGYPVPPKSACVFCPYRSDVEWRWMREHDPESWAAAIEIDRLIRNTPGMRHAEFLHDSRQPLEFVDLSTAEDRGQGNMLMVCEAGCGL